MKKIEILKFNREVIEKLISLDIPLKYVWYVDMFEDYSIMVLKGYKKSYIVAFLAEKYHVCERQIYKLVRKLKEECTEVAV